MNRWPQEGSWSRLDAERRRPWVVAWIGRCISPAMDWEGLIESPYLIVSFSPFFLYTFQPEIRPLLWLSQRPRWSRASYRQSGICARLISGQIWINILQSYFYMNHHNIYFLFIFFLVRSSPTLLLFRDTLWNWLRYYFINLWWYVLCLVMDIDSCLHYNKNNLHILSALYYTVSS